MIVTVIGLGLIGGSMALALKNNGFAERVFGVDINTEHGHKALELGLIDAYVGLEEGVIKCDVVIMATPVNHIVTLLPFIMNIIDDQIIMDVGSTKQIIMETASRHPKQGRFVGSHPMAGTEYSGPEAALPHIFKDKVAVIVDKDQVDRDALETVQALYESLSMKLSYYTSTAHDMHTAYISHISHISSFALALTVLEKEKDEQSILDLAGGGFRSTVRLAHSHPDTWVPIFQQNRDHVLDVLDEHINSISKFRTFLIKKDFTSFYDLIKQANRITV